MFVRRRNAKRISKGVLPEEMDGSDFENDSDGESEDEAQSGAESDGSESGESSSQVEDESSNNKQSSKKQRLGDDLVRAGMRWVKPGRAGEAGSEGSDEEDSDEDEDENPDREIAFPAQCSLCKKTLFNLHDLQDHMTSKAHAKKQRKYEQGTKKFFRTANQIAKLKARNHRKKERKMMKRKSDQAKKGHVWGEHKKPPKSAEQRAADAAAAKPKPKITPFKRMAKSEEDTGKNEPNKRRGHKQHHSQKGAGGRGRPGDKSDFDSLPKQQGKRKNRERT